MSLLPDFDNWKVALGDEEPESPKGHPDDDLPPEYGGFRRGDEVFISHNAESAPKDVRGLYATLKYPCQRSSVGMRTSDLAAAWHVETLPAYDTRAASVKHPVGVTVKADELISLLDLGGTPRGR